MDDLAPLSSPGLSDSGPWPGVADPVTLLGAIAEWLASYGNPGTRRTYAEGLGLPVSAADLSDWHADRPPGWAEATARYAAVLGVAPARRGGPPPAPRGKLRALHWLRWCASAGVDPCSARSMHVKAWLAALADAGAAVATRDRMLATVKALYGHLAEVGLAAGNPAALDRRRLGLVVPAGSASGTVSLTAAQVRALHEAAGTPRRGAGPVDLARASAVVALFTLGLRVGEICGLDRGDLHVTRGRRALRVRGKGGKTRIVYLHALAESSVSRYLRVLDAVGGSLPARRERVSADVPLLRTRSGARFQRQAVWQLLRRLAASGEESLLEVAEAMHPHALRHFYVTAAVEAGAQVVHVQADVGHTSIDTTEQVYNSAARDPGRSAVDLVGDVLAGESEERQMGGGSR
ncbi:tyrosine-type recombinase/integrase [Actinokineospora guangxiensis]|uniref:Tyrosine-type recombinase/integrase n=1 Tax=Actinokineospora guangxiensis TaxID=1490288 RepID=A0ABW0ELZ8_9PSEU